MAVAAAAACLGWVTPAWAATESGLTWTSPLRITSGQPVSVASIQPCPPVPTPGDSIMVQINLSFGPGGASGQVLDANPDGSWSGDVTFSFSGVKLHHTTVNAECLDFSGNGATPYAQYQNHHAQIFG